MTLRIVPKPPRGTTYSWGAVKSSLPDFYAFGSARRSRTWIRRFDHVGTYYLIVQFTLPNRSGLDALRGPDRTIRVRTVAADTTRYCTPLRGIGRQVGFIATSTDCTTAKSVLAAWMEDEAIPAPWRYAGHNRAQDRHRFVDGAGGFIRAAAYQDGD